MLITIESLANVDFQLKNIILNNILRRQQKGFQQSYQLIFLQYDGAQQSEPIFHL